MYELQPQETKALCAAAQDIITYKGMLAAGFGRLADGADDSKSADLLAEIAQL